MCESVIECGAVGVSCVWSERVMHHNTRRYNTTTQPHTTTQTTTQHKTTRPHYTNRHNIIHTTPYTQHNPQHHDITCKLTLHANSTTQHYDTLPFPYITNPLIIVVVTV